MDNSPETKKAPTEAAPASAPAPQPAAPAKTSSTDDYKTANIGKWKSKQEDYFAKQNQERSDKKAKRKATFKKILPFAIAFGVVVVVGLGTWGVISLINYINRPASEETTPDPSVITGKSSQDIYRYQAYLQQVYDDSDDSIEAVSQAVANTLETSNGQQYSAEVALAEMLLFQRNEHYEETIDRGLNLNPDVLDTEQKIIYYNMLSYCYSMIGNEEKSAEYLRIGYDISVKRGGEGG